MNFWDHHKAITCYYELLMSSVCQKYQLRQMEYDILMFLYHNPQYHTAADIVRVRNSTKSHVSTSLKVLEERGLIEKKVADGNKNRKIGLIALRSLFCHVNTKHIDVYLSASAQPIIAEGLEAQRQFARDMFQGLSEPQIAACKQAFQKICDNAEECLKIKGMTHHES